MIPFRNALVPRYLKASWLSVYQQSPSDNMLGSLPRLLVVSGLFSGVVFGAPAVISEDSFGNHTRRAPAVNKSTPYRRSEMSDPQLMLGA